VVNLLVGSTARRTSEVVTILEFRVFGDLHLLGPANLKLAECSRRMERHPETIWISNESSIG
jgi:hypothetical protein